MDLALGVAEAGCWLEPSAAGRGLATRAARVIIDWAIEERGHPPRGVAGRVAESRQHRRGTAVGNDQRRCAARVLPASRAAARCGGLVSAGHRVAGGHRLGPSCWSLPAPPPIRAR
ncbi:GNAT family N-acetyltransferase [Nocardia sp. NPDC052278]|uniref:GNAT family N-acetyltransferase n=1 Tax=unclassified Nocardia TaxID=2637762 RepID=UPI0036C6F4E4